MRDSVTRRLYIRLTAVCPVPCAMYHARCVRVCRLSRRLFYPPVRRDARASTAMRRTVLLLLALAALLGTGSAAGPSTEDKKKAIRMKSTPKLKEILADLGIEHDAAIGKEELRELVLQEDALTKWEKKHPGQKKVRAYCLANAWPPHVHVHVRVHTVCALHMHTHMRPPVLMHVQHCMYMHIHADTRGVHAAMHTTLNTLCAHRRRPARPAPPRAAAAAEVRWATCSLR